MAINVYKYPQVLHLTVGHVMPNCQRTGNQMITSQHYTNSTVKLFRRADQRIDLLLKDWDRRPIKFDETQRIFFKLFSEDREIIEKEAELWDYERGRYVLEFTATETASLPLGDYQYCIVVRDEIENTTNLLWSDQTYGARAPCLVCEGPVPPQSDAITVSVPDTILSDYYTTSALVGAMQVINPMGVHSVVLQGTDLTTTVIIEGSQEVEIPTSNAWVELDQIEIADLSGSRHIAIVGNHNWIRLKFTTVDGLTAISYRNS